MNEPVTRIGVISDTHMSRCEDRLFDVAETVFQDVSVLLHAGDHTHPSVLDAFAHMEVHAVSGNCDGPDVRALHPPMREIDVAGIRIGLVHGWGDRSRVPSNVFSAFRDVDAIVFGHTHVPMCRREKGVLLFNPGSASRNRGGIHDRSVGILTIGADGDICGAIVPI